jgi:hypothetical protein
MGAVLLNRRISPVEHHRWDAFARKEEKGIRSAALKKRQTSSGRLAIRRKDMTGPPNQVMFTIDEERGGGFHPSIQRQRFHE